MPLADPHSPPTTSFTTWRVRTTDDNGARTQLKRTTDLMSFSPFQRKKMFALFRQNFRDSLAATVVALLCVLGIGFLQVPQLNQLRGSEKTASKTLAREIHLEKLRLDLLQQMPTFGFDNLIADWTLLNFLQYFGDDEVREKTGYSLSPDYFEVILARDPYFLQAYLFLSTSASMYAAMPERSVALMEKGLKSLSPKVPPRSYYIWRYKGIDELLFLGSPQAAKRSFAMAAQWASTYSDEESKQVAALSRRTAEFLAGNPKSKSAQIAAWAMVLTSPVDAQTREIAIKRIEALGGKVSITPQAGVQITPPKED